MTERAATDAAALAWAADLADEGIQLVDEDGQPLPTAAIALAFELAKSKSCKDCARMTPKS